MRQAKKKLKQRIVLGVMVVCACTLGVLCVVGHARRWRSGSLEGGPQVTFRSSGLSGHHNPQGGAHEGEDRVLSSSSCSSEIDSPGMVVLYVIGILYSFLGLAIVTDEFFQPSLEAISEALQLTPDVAGATFLAAGSSAPELFTSLADAFGKANSTGTGTIVGSAMFNILVIVALSAAVAGRGGKSIPIDWRPVSRDVIFYLLSIVLLSMVYLDSEVRWWEGLIMTLSYGLYILFMVYNERILGSCKSSNSIPTIEPLEGELDAGVAAVVIAPSDRNDHKLEPDEKGGESTAKVTPFSSGDRAHDVADSVADNEAESRVVTARVEMVDRSNQDAAEKGQAGQVAGAGAEVQEGEEEPERSRFEWPKKSLVDQALFIISLPLQAIFFFTIPDCGNPKYEKWYAVSFVMCLVWIGALTHFMVEWANAVGCYAGVSPIFMGLLVLSVGTSVPDALGSMIAARKGEANMAIANAVGSNVFDVLIGLGLPWFLRGVILSEPMDLDRDGIELNVIILFCTAILFVIVLALRQWSMNTKTGLFLFALYLAYVVFVIVREVA
ncbi:unnamed protein product [Ascophyllum nodosum]